VMEAEAVLGYTLGAMPRAARDVLAERQRQIEAEGWTPAHDDEHEDGQLAAASASYAVASVNPSAFAAPPSLWPWTSEWWKPSTRRRMLVKGGALILAEIERLDRAAAKNPQA